MAKSADLSVVIATFNRPAQLIRCLHSIISQSLRPREVIVVHDGPGVDTRRALQQEFPMLVNTEFIRINETEIWHGRPAPARNRGIELAIGEFVAFCDDDDIWSPVKLGWQMRVFAEYPATEALFTEYIPVSGEVSFGACRSQLSAIAPPENGGCLDVEDVNLRRFLMWGGVCHSSAVIRKRCASGSLFPEIKTVKAFEDFGAYLYLSISGYELRHLRLPLVGYLSNNPTSIRGNVMAHNIRVSAYVMKELLSAGKPLYLVFFFWGRLQALLKKLFRN